MDTSKSGGQERGMLSATNRQLWPSMKFTPAGRPAAPDPGVILVRCVELLCRAAEQAGVGASEQAGRRASEQANVRAISQDQMPIDACAPVPALASPPAPAPASPPAPFPASPPAPASPDAPALASPPAPKGRGWPRILTPLKREVILKALSQGKSRTQAAKGVNVCPATIRLEIKRDATFALDVQVAEEEGREFRQVFERLFVPGRVRLETEPVIGTPEFEREKEFLISRGLSRDWISRMRLVREDEVEALARYAETGYQMAAKKGFRNEMENALNFMAGEEIIETEFSPDGRQVERVKIRRRPPPSDTAASSRLARLESLLDMSPLDMEMLIAEMESRPWECNRCRKKQEHPKKQEYPRNKKPPGGTGGEERGTTTSTVQRAGAFAGAGDGSVPLASSIRRRRVRRVGLAEVHSLVNVSNTSGDS